MASSALIQKFRWVHFPRNANLDGDFHYRVTPVFMNAQDELSYGLPQEAAIELRREYAHPYYWAPFILVGADSS